MTDRQPNAWERLTPEQKRMAKGAGIGALVAIPLPFVGPIIGAIAGAGISWLRDNNRRP